MIGIEAVRQYSGEHNVHAAFDHEPPKARTMRTDPKPVSEDA